MESWRLYDEKYMRNVGVSIFLDGFQLDGDVFSKLTQRGSCWQFIRDRAIVVKFNLTEIVTSIKINLVSVVTRLKWINPVAVSA
jgi:hypothetical protein